MSFRQAYKLVSKNAIRWFPGHMDKGLKQMQQKLRSIDCIIEVHDARVPFSGRNPEFHYTLTGGGLKPHILVLNKKDLADTRERRHIVEELQQRAGTKHVIFTNCRDQQCQGIKRLLPLANELISTSERFHRAESEHCLMIIGVPNVGKSSLLNIIRNRNLRRKGATQVGATAGITRSVLEKIKIAESPLTYMIDTPGILEPRIADDEMGMKLALIGCLPDHLVGEDLIADYLLYWLNRQHRFGYVPIMGLLRPTDNIAEALIACANKLGVQRKLRKFDNQMVLMPDVMLAARHFIRLYRRGDLGGTNLDKDFIDH